MTITAWVAQTWIEEQPAWAFTLPSNLNDAIFRPVGGPLFAIVAAIQLGHDRGAAFEP